MFSPRRLAVPPRAAVATVAVLVLVLPLAVLARLRWRPLDDVDQQVDRAVHRFVLAHHWLLDTARALTHLGDPVVVTALTALLAVVLFVRHRRREALYVVAVRLLAVAVAWGVKTAVDRARPVLADPVAHASGHSFPSGHAFGAAALWVTAAVLIIRETGRRRPAVAVGVVVPVVVATTRVLLGVHFVSDVVGGLVLGAACALVLADVLAIRADEPGPDPELDADPDPPHDRSSSGPAPTPATGAHR